MGRVELGAGDEVHERTGYSRPHTTHCGPDGIYVSALGAPDGNGSRGVFVMDHGTFEYQIVLELGLAASRRRSFLVGPHPKRGAASGSCR